MKIYSTSNILLERLIKNKETTNKQQQQKKHWVCWKSKNLCKLGNIKKAMKYIYINSSSFKASAICIGI